MSFLSHTYVHTLSVFHNVTQAEFELRNPSLTVSSPSYFLSLEQSIPRCVSANLGWRFVSLCLLMTIFAISLSASQFVNLCLYLYTYMCVLSSLSVCMYVCMHVCVCFLFCLNMYSHTYKYVRVCVTPECEQLGEWVSSGVCADD